MVNNDFEEPNEDDYVTTDHIKWWQGGKLVLVTRSPTDRFSSADDAYAQVRAHMDKNKFWPERFLGIGPWERPFD